MHQSLRIQPLTANQSLTPERRSPSPQHSARPLVSASIEPSEAQLEEEVKGRKRPDTEEANPQDDSQNGSVTCSKSSNNADYRTVPISFKNKSAVRLPPINPSKAKQHKRKSTVDSEDGLLRGDKRETQETGDLAAISSYPSDHGHSTFASKSGLKCLESAQEDVIPTYETYRGSPYGAGRVEICTKARSELLCTGKGLEGRQVIVEMATSVPREYPVLDLSEKGLEDDDLEQLGRLMDVYPFAVSLDLYGNRLKFSSTEAKAAHIPHPSLSYLSLSHNPLSPLPPHTSLNSFLASFPKLRTLELADCALTDEDLLRIGADIAAISTLKRLDLSGNRLTEGSQAAIQRILSANSTLEQLDFRRNPVSRHFRHEMRSSQPRLLLDEDKRCCPQCTLQ